MNRPSDDDYDERGAIGRMLASEAAQPVQPPPAIVMSDRSGKWFHVFCLKCQRKIGVGETQAKDAAQEIADIHNQREHPGA
jgi:hypothetical protein